MPEQKGKPKEADFISKVVKDPQAPPNTILLEGYVGTSSETGYTRLYFDPQLSSYVEIPNEAILHTQEIPKEQSPLGASYIWIQRDAELIHGKATPDRVKAKFFEGPIAQGQAGGAQAGAIPPLTLVPGCHPTLPQICHPTLPPVCHPTLPPVCHPTVPPMCHPTLPPVCHPTLPPVCHPTLPPVCHPTFPPLCHPTLPPVCHPTVPPVCHPTLPPLCHPTLPPVCHPTLPPVCHPTLPPVCHPTLPPLCHPTLPPVCHPTVPPACHPTVPPGCHPTLLPVCHPQAGAQLFPVTPACPSLHVSPCPSPGLPCPSQFITDCPTQAFGCPQTPTQGQRICGNFPVTFVGPQCQSQHLVGCPPSVHGPNCQTMGPTIFICCNPSAVGLCPSFACFPGGGFPGA